MPITTIQMRSDNIVPDLISGVIVEFYTTLGAFVTSGTTDGTGDVTVSLPAALYDIVMYKQGITILPRQPQRITVLTQIPPNVFKVFAHIRVMPETIDPTLCRVSGFIVNSHGKPQKGVKITIGPCRELIDIGLKLVDPDHQVTVTSDDKGYVEFDLLRKVSYEAFILYKDEWQSFPPGRLSIKAPDMPSVPLEYLLFPVPGHVAFSVSAISVGVGIQDDTTDITITYTDFNVRQTPLSWGGFNLINSDATKFDYEVAGDTLIIKGLASGIATLTAVRTLTPTSLWIPEPPFVADVLTVTVT